MAGMGLQGGTSRCYDQWMDYLKCMDESKGPTIHARNKECTEWMEDYNECLHHEKQNMRSFLMEREQKRQQAASEGAAKEGGS